MNDDGTLPPEQPLSRATSTNQQTDAVDDTNITLHDGFDSNTFAPQAPVVFTHDDNNNLMKSATAAAAGGSYAAQHDRNLDVMNVTLSKPQRKRKNRAENKKRDKHAHSLQRSEREVDDSTEEILDAHTLLKRPPIARSESSFAKPTKASLGWQTEKSQASPSADPPWKSAGSQSVSRPGSAHQSNSVRFLSCANSQVETSKRSESYDGPRYESVRRHSLNSHHELQQDETLPETQHLSNCEPAATSWDTNSVELPSDLIDSPLEVHFSDLDVGPDFQEYPEECINPEYVDPQKENQHLKSELQRADEKFYHLHVELQESRADVDHLYSAWLEVCAAAEVTSEAVEHFHFLVTGSDVSEDSRAAVYQELKANKLYRQISGMRETIENLQQESKSKDEVIAVFRARLASVHDILADGADLQHDSTNWRNLYEEEQQRFKALKEQNKRLRAEAEHMYQPDLERSYKECQAALVKTQDQNNLLTEKLRKTEEEGLCWQHEAKQHKEELGRRSTCFDEQTDVQNKEMLDVVQEYRGKVQDNKHWDENGLIVKNEQLEREQVVLTEELEHVKRSNANKDNEIEKLFEKHQQDQKEIRRLRNVQSVGSYLSLSRVKDGLPQEGVEELQEK